jgi:hypothetical protein
VWLDACGVVSVKGSEVFQGSDDPAPETVMENAVTPALRASPGVRSRERRDEPRRLRPDVHHVSINLARI